MSHFLELRLRAAECRATQRAQKDLYEQIKAEATQRAQPVGKNAEERAVALTLALAQDAMYQSALVAYRRAEAETERVEALLESAIDERRAAEWQIRARLADALFRADVQTDERDAADDNAFDDALLYNLDTQAAYAAGR